jgi:hypothetical protein
MSYVPIIVTTREPPSHRARELADRLSRVIVDFEQHHPTVSNAEVRQATRLALQASRRGSDVAPAIASALVLLIFLMVGIGVFVVLRGGGRRSAQSPLMGLAIVAGLMAVVSVVVRRNL